RRTKSCRCTSRRAASKRKAKARGMSNATHLIALDWGTTSLRAALLDGAGTIVDHIHTDDGIMGVAVQGFQAVFDRVAAAWLRDHPDAAVLAAGMAGSRQGWCE